MLTLSFGLLAKDVKLLPVVQSFEQVRFGVLRWRLALRTLSRTFRFCLLLHHCATVSVLALSPEQYGPS